MDVAGRMTGDRSPARHGFSNGRHEGIEGVLNESASPAFAESMTTTPGFEIASCVARQIAPNDSELEGKKFAR